jgi:predicted Fe-Mo cluster-binding NifX family protein
MTRIAIPTWEGRTSPVFDVAEHLLIVDVTGSHERGRTGCGLSDTEPRARAQALSARDVSVLICGAVSRAMEDALTAAGIAVVSGICGDVEDVLRAFSSGTLEITPSLHLPGTVRERSERCGARSERRQSTASMS